MLPMVELKTNLMIACEHKNEEIFDILTRDKNINFLLEDNRNRTALFYAIINKNKIVGEKYARTLMRKCPDYVSLLLSRLNPILRKKVLCMKPLL